MAKIRGDGLKRFLLKICEVAKSRTRAKGPFRGKIRRRSESASLEANLK